MDEKSLQRLELDKILSAVSDYAVLEGGKRRITSCLPSTSLEDVRFRLACTQECDRLLFKHGIGKIEYFGDLDEILSLAEKGSALSCGQLLEANALLRSARIAFDGLKSVNDNGIEIMRSRAEKLYFDGALEEDITSKILSSDSVSDYASDKLFSIRSRIKSLNERIRAKLSEYLTKDAQYLQDGIVTIRNDRYVIPVKAEYKSRVRGFVHDRSQTGATFFVEPEYVLELNNELIALSIDEREEVEAILRALSKRLGSLANELRADMQILFDMDADYARAEYGYKLKCTKPNVNGRGYINIVKGRHPLIDAKKIVPVSIELGADYDFLILSGANTGGKTVTLKMCGLFCLMAASGLFIPACEGSSVAVFENVFCDIGDSQSIEESLSTFSSHLLNVINICNGANGNSLVLIDELGGGTNPDEGQALAKAVVKHLLSKGCKGIVTTHFTPLKEFAYTLDRCENASMEFDSDTLKPLYSIKIGLAGASNALAISRRLGLPETILNDATGFLSEGARSFENVLRRAEDSRLQAEEKLSEVTALENEWKQKVNLLNSRIEELNAEKEKISRSARVESRRIISERTERAEQILEEIEGIFKKEEISQSDLIKARTLKNKLENISYDEEERKPPQSVYRQASRGEIKVGSAVFVKPMQSRGQVVSLKRDEAEVQCGSMKMHCKLSDLLLTDEQKKAEKVKVVKHVPQSQPMLEINLLGLTVEEALYEVDNFIDRAVMDNLEEIKVIHGVGTGKLKNAIAQHLKRHKNVESFRAGKYGEGESGVTVIKIK
ncbi:MAG: endonuclease MutS2 [Clostridia bacterium]|nr:endonuclease MutS2 [Clostridia bacterium]